MRLVSIALTLGMYAGVCDAQTAPTRAQIAGYTGLHLAAHQNDVAEIERLTAQGADPNGLDSSQRTAAHVAAFASNDDALRALASAGVNMNALEYQKYDVLTIAAVANDAVMVSLAIRLGNRADLITSVYDGTALIAAAHLGHAEVVRELIAGGAPLDHINNLGWTALIEAVVLGNGGPNHQASVRALVEAGADIDIGDLYGVTPLQHSHARGFLEIAAIIQTAD